MVLITLAVVGMTALVTGISSYFIFRPSAGDQYIHGAKMTAETAASIRDDVILQERPDTLGIITICLLIIIVIFKLIELASIAMGAYKRAMKKKYTKRQLLPLVTTQPTAASVNQE